MTVSFCVKKADIFSSYVQCKAFFGSVCSLTFTPVSLVPSRSIADWLKAPDTMFLLDFIKPEFLLLRVRERYRAYSYQKFIRASGLTGTYTLTPHIGFSHTFLPSLLMFYDGFSSNIWGHFSLLCWLTNMKVTSFSDSCLAFWLWNLSKA